MPEWGNAVRSLGNRKCGGCPMTTERGSRFRTGGKRDRKKVGGNLSDCDL